MRLIDTIRKGTDNIEDYIIKYCCPSSFGPEYDGYDNLCDSMTCRECWNQEFKEYMGGEEA